MKKLFIILPIGLVSMPAFSQIKFGLKVAAATTTVPTYDVSSGSTNIDDCEKFFMGMAGRRTTPV